jgi:hypothetical protein
MNDSNRIQFLEQKYFEELIWSKSINLWLIRENNKQKYPFACDYTIRKCIDRCVGLNKKNILNKDVSYEDIGRMEFLELKLFNFIKWDHERNLWSIGDFDTNISVSSNRTLRKTIDIFIGA